MCGFLVLKMDNDVNFLFFCCSRREVCFCNTYSDVLFCYLYFFVVPFLNIEFFDLFGHIKKDIINRCCAHNYWRTAISF